MAGAPERDVASTSSAAADDPIQSDLSALLSEDAERYRNELDKLNLEIKRLHNEIRARADQMREHDRKILKLLGAKGVAPAEKVAHIPPAPKTSGAPGDAQKGKPGDGGGVRQGWEKIQSRRS